MLFRSRGFTSSEQVNKFLTDMKQKNKDIKQLEKKTGFQKYEQRSYDNLNALYANKKA